MRRFVLDTNICLAFVRGHPIYKKIETDLQLNGETTIIIISVVTKAELLSLDAGIQFLHWPRHDPKTAGYKDMP